MKWTIILYGWSAFAAAAFGAELKLASIFSDRMVLQRDMSVPVWGWGTPGEQVTVAITNFTAHATVDAKGKWMARLPSMAASTNPMVLTVTGSVNTNPLVRKNVLIGEVWLAAGEVNMKAMKPLPPGFKTDDPTAMTRCFAYQNAPTRVPQDDVDARWCWILWVHGDIASTFAQCLNRELNVPIGIISAVTYGWEGIVTWIPPEGFAAHPELKLENEWLAKARAAYEKSKIGVLDAMEKWVTDAKAAREAGSPLPDPPSWPKQELWSKDYPDTAPMVNYNALIHPVKGYAMRGVVWGQGEVERMFYWPEDGRAVRYADLMRALIGGWRKVWGQPPSQGYGVPGGEFPFYFVQPPMFLSDGPLLWGALNHVLSVPNTGMVVARDIPVTGEYFFADKCEVGRRLALWALVNTYGRKDLVFSGPLYESHKIEGNAVRVTFKYVGGGLVARDGKPLTGFQLAGKDRKFVDAEARVEGASVVLSAGAITNPVAVRLGWDVKTVSNLANKEGLPAGPFRTDDWDDLERARGSFGITGYGIGR